MRENKAFRRLLRREAEDLSREEIRALLDRELSQAEPDPDLIEDCLDAIASPQTPAPRPRPRLTPLRIALAAALAALLLAGGAAALEPSLFAPPVRQYRDGVRIGHTEAPDAAAGRSSLALALAAHGMDPVPLPALLSDGTYTVDSIEYQSTPLVQSANIRFSAGKTVGTLVVSAYAQDAALPETDYAGAKDVRQIRVGAVDCWLFARAKGYALDYVCGRTLCQAVIEGDLAAAKSLAESIR